MNAAVQAQPLGRILDRLIDYRGKTPEKTASGVKLITAKVIKGGRIEDENHEFIAEENYESWMRRGLPQQWDVLITTEAPLGEVAMLRTTEKIALAQRVILLRANSEIADQNYLYQALKSPLVQARLQSRATGTTVLGIKQSELIQVEIPLPDLPVQRRIASILSAYDDLIENNTRRIAILEDVAQRIYEEWFVRFRFPGHGQNQYSDDNLPSGWMRSKLAEVSKKIGSGATPLGGKSSYKEEGVALIRSQNIYDYRFVDDGLAFLDTEQAAALEAVTIEPEDVLINITGASVGRCCMAPRRHLPARVNQHVMILRADSELLKAHYLLLTINSPVKKQQLLTYAQTGATREALTKDRLSQFEIILPDQKTLALFEQVAGNALRLCEIIAEQTAKLTACRDLLLPKLISGEIDVSSLPEPEAAVA